MDDRAVARTRFEGPFDTRYFDAAAWGPRLRATQDAGRRVLASGNDGWGESWSTWAEQAERVRTLAAGIFEPHGPNPDAVALVPSVAHAFSLAAACTPLSAGDAVLVLADGFPSNVLPWQRRCAQAGAHMLPVVRGSNATAAVLAAIDAEPRLRVASLEYAHWHDGEQLDLDAISDALAARDAALVLDLTQSLGAQAVDLARWRPAFAASAGYKWLLGPMGLAYLWVAPEHRDDPFDASWTACEERESWAFDALHLPTPRFGARRFDAGGVVNGLSLALVEPALQQVRDWGAQRIAAWLAPGLADLTHAVGHAFTTPHRAAPHFVGLRPRRAPLHDCITTVRAAGFRCTARQGALRIAPHLQVSEASLQELARVLAEIC